MYERERYNFPHHLGLILVDPPITGRYLVDAGKDKEMSEIALPSRFFLGGYEDFLDPSLFRRRERQKIRANRRCLMKGLMYYWLIGWPEYFNPKAPATLAMSYFLLRIVAAEWVKYVAVMHRGVKQYEYSDNEFPSLLHRLEKLNSDMRSLQSWRGRSRSSQKKSARLLVYSNLTNPRKCAVKAIPRL